MTNLIWFFLCLFFASSKIFINMHIFPSRKLLCGIHKCINFLLFAFCSTFTIVYLINKSRKIEKTPLIEMHHQVCSVNVCLNRRDISGRNYNVRHLHLFLPFFPNSSTIQCNQSTESFLFQIDPSVQFPFGREKKILSAFVHCFSM